MVQRHRRYQLSDVTVDGQAVGSATIDAWLDDAGVERWCARLLVPSSRHLEGGVLVGTRRDGSRVCGDVTFGGTHPGPGSGRIVLVELHGRGDISPYTEPAPQASPDDGTTAGA